MQLFLSTRRSQSWCLRQFLVFSRTFRRTCIQQKKPKVSRNVLQTVDKRSPKRVKVDSVYQDSVATRNQSNSLQTNTNFNMSFIARKGLTSEHSSILHMNSPPQPSYNSTTSANEDVPMQKIEAGASASTASWLQQLSSEHPIPMPNPAWNTT